MPSAEPPPASRDSARHDPAHGEGVVEGTLFALLAHAATSLFTAGLTLYLVRALGPGDYGLLSIAFSVLAIAMLLADFAISHSAGRFIADLRHDIVQVRAVVAASLRIKIVAVLVIATLLMLLAGPIATAYGRPRLTWPLRAIALSLVFESMLLLWLTVFGSLRRLALSARVISAESLVEASASIGLVALGAGVTGAALGRAAGYAVGASVGAFVVTRLLGREIFDGRSAPREMRERIRRYARPLFATNGAYTAYATLDVQLIAALLSSAAVGIFSAPLRLVVFLSNIGQSVANAVAPRMSLSAPGGPDVRAFTTAVRGLLLLYIALAVGLVVWADPITSLLLGDEFEGSVEVMRALAPFLVLGGVSPLISTTVNYLGQAGSRLPIVLASLVVNAGIDLALLPRMGPVGAAIGASVAYGIYVPGHLWLCRRAFPVALRPLALTLARGGLAGAAMAAVLLVLGTDHLAPWEWLAGGMLGPVAFVAVLLVTGELSRREISAVRQRFGRRRG